MTPRQLSDTDLTDHARAIREGRSTLEQSRRDAVMREFRRRFPNGPDKPILTEVEI